MAFTGLRVDLPIFKTEITLANLLTKILFLHENGMIAHFTSVQACLCVRSKCGFDFDFEFDFERLSFFV